MPSLLFELSEWLVSPYINHFISADTVVPAYANPQDLNRYGYVLNNPLRYTDPTGNRACGDGEDVDCGGHKQDPLKNPHVPKSPKPDKDKAGGGDKPLLAPSEINSDDTIQWCEPLDCALSGASFLASAFTFAPPPIDIIAFGVDVVATGWAGLRTWNAWDQGKISTTRFLALEGTGIIGLVPFEVGAGSSFINGLMTATGIPN